MDVHETSPIFVERTDTIEGQLNAVHEHIRKRAHALYLERGAIDGYDLDDWLLAEQELTYSVPTRIHDDPYEIVLEMDLEVQRADDVNVWVTSNEALVATQKKANREVFTRVQFPQAVLTDTVEAELDRGVLRFFAAPVEDQKRRKLAHALIVKPLAKQKGASAVAR